MGFAFKIYPFKNGVAVFREIDFRKRRQYQLVFEAVIVADDEFGIAEILIPAYPVQ